MSHTDKIFYTIVAGFVGGIFLRSFADWGSAFTAFVGFLALCFFCLRFTKPVGTYSSAKHIFKSPRVALPPHRRVAEEATTRHFQNMFCGASFFLALFLFSAAVGMLRYDFADRTAPRHALDAFLGQTVSLEGVVSDEPDERETVTRMIVQTPHAKVLMTTDRAAPFVYGDQIQLTGKVDLPKSFEDETTLRVVDYPQYLAKDGIYYESYRPHITLVAHGGGNPVIAALFSFKRSFLGNIERLIREPHASLLGGLIVGAKHSLGKKLLDDFRTVGVIHIVVLSGYNITIIGYFIEWLLSRLRKNVRLALASGAMIAFAILVGASATVVRATLMALFVILAKATGRLYVVTRALLVAGVIMLLHNPHILVFDVSFQLSFLATVGLIYLSPLIEPRVRWVTERFKLREVAVATVATQLFVLPFILYKTGLFSVVALPVNLLILAAIPATMLCGFLAGMCGFIGNLVALPFAWAAYALLAYELAVVEWFARLPFAAFTLASFPAWVALLWYAGYGVVIARLRAQSSSLSRPN